MTEHLVRTLGLYAGTPLIAFIAGLFPIISIELFLVGLGVAHVGGVDARTLALLCVLAAVGHQVAKTICYFGGEGALERPRIKPRVDALRARIERWNRYPSWIMFLGATVGLPPMYVLCFIAKPLMRMSFGRFTVICFGGRIGRYMVMSLVPLLIACGGGGADEPDAPPTQWEQVKSHYGVMRAIAGAGATDSGTNEWLAQFEGGPAVSAELSRPHMAMADGAGNIYIADKEAHAIRKVTPAGAITTVAGTGVAGPPDDTAGPATQRDLANPNGLFVRADGTLYILDLDHARIRKVTPDGTMTTLVTAPAGILLGRGLWVDGPDGGETVWFASGNVVMKWTAAGGLVTWAGGFAGLGNIAMDASGRMLVADRAGNRVWAVTETNGVTAKTVVAGNGSAGNGVDGAPATMTPLEGVRAVYPAYGDDGGGFFAGTHEGCQLWFIDAAGTAHLFLDGKKDAHAGVGEPFDTPGNKVSELRSVTLDARGDVLFVDDDRGFVRLVERK